jgi:hypothetical protein
LGRVYKYVVTSENDQRVCLLHLEQNRTSLCYGATNQLYSLGALEKASDDSFLINDRMTVVLEHAKGRRKSQKPFRGHMQRTWLRSTLSFMGSLYDDSKVSDTNMLYTNIGKHCPNPSGA